jgi:hypothetical protein
MNPGFSKKVQKVNLRSAVAKHELVRRTPGVLKGAFLIRRVYSITPNTCERRILGKTVAS